MCLIVAWLFAEHKIQLLTDTQQDAVETHATLAAFIAFAGGT